MFGLSSLGLRVAAVGVLLAAIAGYVLYHDHVEIAKGRAEELALFKTSSDKLLAEANAKIKAETEQHAADVAANQVKLDAQLKANSRLSDSLDQRVRDFQAYRRSHPDLACPASGSAAAPQGNPSAPTLGDRTLQLVERGNDLYRSNGELSDTLQACERDRDSLKGLPR